MSGLEVLERLRAAGSGTPVLMLTALTDVPARVRGLGRGRGTTTSPSPSRRRSLSPA